MKSLAGVDVGGTFTDLAFWDDQHKTVFLHKVLTTPQDATEGIVSGIAGLPQPPQAIVHGTTLVTNALIASIETLLSIEAVDRLDPHRRISPPNRELIAQGVGNIVSGLIGGIPVTSVIVRSSANVQAGGRTRLSAMIHGVLLLVGVLLLPSVLNEVPLAALAVVLIVQ